ncbi:MAG: acyl-CoA dehydrogenase C-terminal domain-containing protein, partial [Nitratireductor sp.]
ATCVMNYDGAIGHLVGEENNGLKAMFKMMNEARLQVAMQGHGQSVISYQNAATYAKERLQGRSLTGAKFPDKAADPIIVHPDVRRNLMDIKSFNEAARAFILWTALNSDLKNRSKDEIQQEEASDLLELLTPVLKAFITDKSFDNCVKAQQVFGGHGYIKEWGMEQYVRDARIMQIYEGANGVQALDLVGRKLAINNGRSVRLFFTRINDFTKKHMANEAMQPFCKPLREANKALEAATLWLMQNGMKNPDNAGAASTDYLHLMGHVTLGYMWALMSEAALQKLDDGDAANKEFYENKLKTSLYYFDRVLPQVQTHLTCIQAGSNAMMALEADAF